jgi:2-keto-4-pentenoate hydratase/2-oxohepta-3-ene-1,7-dioic acid hydratase in catechol pathway
MRLGNLNGRAIVITDDGAIDIERASDGRFGPSLRAVYDAWDAVVDWAAGDIGTATPFASTDLESPSPEPRQVFGIGLNYRSHADETGMPHPEFPPTFTKFVSCIVGPNHIVSLPTATVDYEVELVVVIGRRAEHVSADDAWAHVAGVCVGQDLSERLVQKRPPVPQFSLGKSFPGFGPMGPWITTVDALDDPDDLELTCTINGEVMQAGRTRDLIFSVPELIAKISAITPFLPGDVIFTGTPSGVGAGRTPPRFLRANDVVESHLVGVCAITTRFRDV